MSSDAIIIDGRVDLIARHDADQAPGEPANSQRHSRLNDVMVVLERDRAVFEEALRDGLVDAGLTTAAQLVRVQLTIAPKEPAFEVRLAPDGDVNSPTSRSAAVASIDTQRVEALVEENIIKTIEARIAGGQRRRWNLDLEIHVRDAKRRPGTTGKAVVALSQEGAEASLGSNADSPRERIPVKLRRSGWLLTLMWLLAAMVLATAYLFLTSLRV